MLAEDDDSYAVTVPLAINPRAALTAADEAAAAADDHARLLRPERVLFCGLRRDMDDMILELDRQVAPGSELCLLSAVPAAEREARLLEGGLSVARLGNLNLAHVEGNPALCRHLE